MWSEAVSYTHLDVYKRQMQGQLDTLNENIERLIEQVRIANSYRFGKHTETLDSIDAVSYTHLPPYDGAKKMILVDDVDNRQFLCELVESMWV